VSDSKEHIAPASVQPMNAHEALTHEDLDRLSDEDLILRFQQDDTYAFDVLVRRYKNPLMNYIFRYLGDVDESSDVLQETFVRLYEKKHQYKTIARFSTWIYTIAGNLAKSELRKPHRRRGTSITQTTGDDEEVDMQLEDGDPLPDRMVDGTLKNERIQAALLELPAEFREAVIFRDIQDLSYDDIAEIIQKPIGTVKSRINRGRAMLQNLLRDIYD
jgi:RNA polymerase sigma-70 factor, ECF subfamily